MKTETKTKKARKQRGSMPKKATKQMSRVALELMALSVFMRVVADEMEYFGGFNKLIRQHVFELRGVAGITRGWAVEINCYAHGDKLP